MEKSDGLVVLPEENVTSQLEFSGQFGHIEFFDFPADRGSTWPGVSGQPVVDSGGEHGFGIGGERLLDARQA